MITGEIRRMALATHLNVKLSELEYYGNNVIIYGSEDGLEEYLVVTTEEADNMVASYIKDNVWAFNVDFILDHSKIKAQGVDRELIKRALRDVQQKLCESSNPLLLALIEDFEGFVQDAVAADGRAYFINNFSEEKEYKQGDFLIYRVN